MKYLGLLVLLSGCGADIHISSDPIIIQHKLDLAGLAPYCQVQCQNQANADLCTKNCIENFLKILGSITVP